ncbi:hypothetical protein EWI07_13525 [Sporolactobacillus sp. THM7-4]|nr:hypothetical protein EWI07_13525 [Sporolactobacillus sp. THM7-4]
MPPENRDIGYFTSTVSQKLKMTKSKLRRMTLALERNGYKMTRNHRGQRIYFENDMQAILRLQEKIKKSATIDDAAGEVCLEMNHEEMPENREMQGQDEQKSGSVVRLNPDERMPFLTKQIHLMINEVAAATAEETAARVVEKINRGIDRSIEQRDKELVARLRESSESFTERHRKGWLSKLFSRS